jgi:hypothetical protein
LLLKSNGKEKDWRKKMDDIVGGLFGVSPSELNAQRRARAEARAAAAAQLDPYARASYFTQLGAGGLMGGAMRAMGVEDKQMQEAQQRQQMLSQIDMSSPEAIRKSAKLFGERGDTMTQLRLQKYANDREQEIADAQYKKALSERSGKEKTDLTTIEKLYAARERAVASNNQQMIRSIDAAIAKETNIEKKPPKFSPRDEIRIQKASEAGSAAVDARMLLDSFDTMMDKYKGRLGAAGTIYGESKRWTNDNELAADYETMDAWSKELGAKTLQLFGGSDTEKELEVAIRTNPSVNKTYQANKNIINQKRAALAIAENLQPFQEEWMADNGSLLARNKKGETFSTAWKRYQRENFKPEKESATQQKEAGVPSGVDPAVWNVMTPQEKALWQ